VDDSDCFELSGGKKVSFSTLANVIIEQVGSIDNYTIVDYDGRDEVETFTYTKSSGVITLKQEGHNAMTITIATATTSRPGLMTASDKSNLDTTVDKVVSSLTMSRTASNMSITVTFADNSTKSVALPYATTSYAGLMSATDKSNLESTKTMATALNNKLGAANGIAELDSNGRVKSAQLPLDMPHLITNASVLDPTEWPKVMLYNIDNSDDITQAIYGDVIYVKRSQGNVNIRKLYFVGMNDTVDLGTPNSDTIYCHKSTGLLYKWDESEGDFARIGINLDGNSRMSSSQATPQVMTSMGSTLDNAGNTGNSQIVVTLNVGDTYFDPSTSKIYYKKSSSEDIDLGAPSKLLIYANKQSNKLYRWSGSAFVELG
jgi:hypothetical protein